MAARVGEREGVGMTFVVVEKTVIYCPNSIHFNHML